MILLNLLETVHKYYPVGIPQLYTSYPGYIAMQKITEGKISLVQGDRDYEWKSFINEIESHFSAYKVYNLSYFQFPGFSLTIEIESQNIGACTLGRYIRLNMSLLCNYFTVFGEDIYNFENYNASSTSREPILSRIVYSKQADKAIILEGIEFLKMTFEKMFKNYKFVEHNILFEYSILGTGAFGDMEIDSAKDSPTIYRLLFEHDISPKPVCLL